MRMVLNVVGLFAFIGMTVGAYTQAYYLDEHLELLRFAYMTALEWKEFFVCVRDGRHLFRFSKRSFIQEKR